MARHIDVGVGRACDAMSTFTPQRRGLVGRSLGSAPQKMGGRAPVLSSSEEIVVVRSGLVGLSSA